MCKEKIIWRFYPSSIILYWPVSGLSSLKKNVYKYVENIWEICCIFFFFFFWGGGDLVCLWIALNFHKCMNLVNHNPYVTISMRWWSRLSCIQWTNISDMILSLEFKKGVSKNQQSCPYIKVESRTGVGVNCWNLYHGMYYFSKRCGHTFKFPGTEWDLATSRQLQGLIVNYGIYVAVTGSMWHNIPLYRLSPPPKKKKKSDFQHQ